MSLLITGCDLYKTESDQEAPKLVLNGDLNMTLHVGDTYNEPGAKAYDNIDGEVKVIISGNVDITKPNSYIIKYTAKDKAGNITKKTRIVNVIKDDDEYTMKVSDRVYENNSGYYLHYKEDIQIIQQKGDSEFILKVIPPRGATAILATGDTTFKSDGNYSTYIEVDCTELNSETNKDSLSAIGAIELWIQDKQSDGGSKKLANEALPCRDATKRASYKLQMDERLEESDSNDTNLHYKQNINIIHTNKFEGKYVLDIVPPQGAIVKLNGSSTSLSVTDSSQRSDMLELDCSHTSNSIKDGYIKLQEKDMLLDAKTYTYTNYILSCRKFHILKTGQTVSYVDFDNGYYQIGKNRRYARDNEKEVVIDYATGLMWQDDSDTAKINKPWVTKENYNTGNYSDTTGDTAVTYCSELEAGGYNDWRLPTHQELSTIVDYGKYDPSIDSEFLNSASYYYWTSTNNVDHSSDAWAIHFYDGHHYYDPKYIKYYYIRCVRTIQ
jgi:hypothetical protein